MWRGSIIISLLLLASCSLRRIEKWERSDALLRSPALSFSDSNSTESLQLALEQGISYFLRHSQRNFYFGTKSYSGVELASAYAGLASTLREHGLSFQFYEALQQDFYFYRSAAPQMLVTGYYQASLQGSRTKSERFRFPIYRPPADLVRINLHAFLRTPATQNLPRWIRGRLDQHNLVTPYYDRGAIDYEHKLAGKDLEIAWVDDQLALFFLHIQGSGVIQLDDGSEMHVGFADTNGQPYHAIGNTLIARGAVALEDVSMQSIVSYLRAHPEELESTLRSNPSYVFFHQAQDGPWGSTGTKLVPFRSIASDSELFPPGALALLRTTTPIMDGEGRRVASKKVDLLVLNQDTGGAIKGAARIDLFTGKGSESEACAGLMREQGEIYFLAPRFDSAQ